MTTMVIQNGQRKTNGQWWRTDGVIRQPLTMKHKQKLKKYKAIIKFKHLPWWYKTQIVEAKSEKKVRDIILHMYKDDVLSLEIKENGNQ